jgi:hypothetical protein
MQKCPKNICRIIQRLQNLTKKVKKIPDEYEEVYEENTAYPDSEGKMKDVYEGVEPEHYR